MFHMQLSKLVGIAQAAKRDGSLAAGKLSAKTMSMMERCEKPALWYRMERLKRHGLALAAVQQDGMALKLQNKLIRRDRGIVLAAVKQNGWALRHASEERDREVALEAVRQNGWALQFASEELRGGREARRVGLAVRLGGATQGPRLHPRGSETESIWPLRSHFGSSSSPRWP